MVEFDSRQTQRLERLFDQQMWVLGRDAARPSDNLLVRRGFVRTEPPVRSAASALYRLNEHGLALELSSRGVLASVEEYVVFLDRDPMARQLRRTEATVLQRLMTWFAEYEEWVAETVGDAWRSATLSQRTRRAAYAGSEMPQIWRELAVGVAKGSSR
jgi:hypothetical protein